MHCYIQPGKKLTLAKVLKEIEKRKIKSSYHEELKHTAQALVDLNNALLKGGKGVYAVCEKQPRGNLDTGRHYYSIYYTKKGEPVRLWLGQLTLELGGYRIKDSSRGLPYWVWGSGAIGMSRLLAATDGVFTFLTSLGGCYAQIDCI